MESNAKYSKVLSAPTDEKKGGSDLAKKKKEVKELDAEIKQSEAQTATYCSTSRIIFTLGTLAGGAGVTMNFVYSFGNFPITFGAIWSFISLCAFGFTWNYAVMKSLAESFDKFEEMRKDLKSETRSLHRLVNNYTKQNKKLLKSSNNLKIQEKKLESVSKLLAGDVRKMENLQQFHREQVSKGIKLLENRQDLRKSQMRIITEEKIEALDFQKNDALNRARAFFQDVGAEDRVVDRMEFPNLVKLLRKIKMFKSSVFTFELFTKHAHSKDVIERIDFTNTLRPIIHELHEKERKRLNAEAQCRIEEANKLFASRIEDLKARVKCK
ncbi:hypothetical protein AAMO2058_000904800 [Amorphochlora amoebiformis]|uniref:Uncharacterized protein n=1 Tax=Amorphochlora amoebiformis TaxID=1561963 RepID=A0A7S0DQM7_9EUKA|mmetsp:Transcript_6360/g.9773  ORF Transcript_6360/g.9773 Transcript_6360/m.9773 type:complete len:326 (+) Transcript_6360:105-1082(+)